MIAKPTRAVLSSARKARVANLSVAAMNEEFPHTAVAAVNTTAAPITTATTKNGARVVARDTGASTVSLEFAVMAGGAAETAAQKGAAKFLAAASLAGDANNTGVRLVKQLESVGAEFNATADKEKIVVSVTAPANAVETVASVVLGAVSSAPYAPHVYDDFRATAGLIAAAACPYGTNLNELLFEAAYGEESAFGRPTTGAVSTADVLAFRAANYVASNVVVSANGLSADVVKSLVEAHLSAPTGEKKTASPVWVGGEAKLRADLNGKSSAFVGFNATDAKATSVLAKVLSNRLAAKGVSASAALKELSTAGILSIKTYGSTAAASAALEAAVAELVAIAGGKATAEEVAAATMNITVAKFSALETPATAAGSLLNAFVAGGDAISAADVRGVSASAVSAAAAAALKTVPAYAVYGATSGMPTYAAIQKLVA